MQAFIIHDGVFIRSNTQAYVTGAFIRGNTQAFITHDGVFIRCNTQAYVTHPCASQDPG